MKNELSNKLQDIWDKMTLLYKEGKFEEFEVLEMEEVKLRDRCIHRYNNGTNAIELRPAYDEEHKSKIDFFYCPICCVYRRDLNGYLNINLAQEEINNIYKKELELEIIKLQND